MERSEAALPPSRRYRAHDDDSARWEGFPFRDGDIVVSTRSKHGTTWMQTILLLLIHGQPTLPAPLAELAPWLDQLVEPRDEVVARLEAQTHRRVIKTHTPLDGVPLDPRATYVVVARHPLDAAVSLYHHGANIDRERLAELTGNVGPNMANRAPADAWVTAWIDQPADPFEDLDSLPGVLHHLADAWARRGERNVLHVHYADLLADLGGEMRRIAGLLGLSPPEERWDELVAGATMDRMREQADRLAPDTLGVLKDRTAFFRRGSSGAAAELLEPGTIERYHRRAAELAPPDLLAWLHR